MLLTRLLTGYVKEKFVEYHYMIRISYLIYRTEIVRMFDELGDVCQTVQWWHQPNISLIFVDISLISLTPTLFFVAIFVKQQVCLTYNIYYEHYSNVYGWFNIVKDSKSRHLWFYFFHLCVYVGLNSFMCLCRFEFIYVFM